MLADSKNLELQFDIHQNIEQPYNSSSLRLLFPSLDAFSEPTLAVNS